MPEKTLNNSNIKIWQFYLVVVLFPIVAISSAYIAYTIYRTYPIYNYVKSNQRGWSGQVHKSDKELGFAPIPNTSGSETMPIGPNIPMKYDKDGFRIPIEDEQDTNNTHPTILTLGCSFTYGAATHAKDTFPYLVGKYLGGVTKNAGVCSYGLSQMVILAKRLIPRHQPDYVIVQYSTWLVNRSVSAFVPSYFGKVPSPYYSEGDDLLISPPVFQTKLFDLPIDEYRSGRKGVGDFISFLWVVGLPLFVHDDFNMSVYALARIIGIKEQETTNRLAVIKHAYGEIHRVAEQNGSKVIVVILGNSNRPVSIPNDLLPNSAMVVNAHSAMLKRLPNIDKKNYQQHYNHWRGNPPRIVDSHPNEKAHRIIAEEIVSKIVESPNKAN